MKGNTGKCCDKGECLIAEARGAQHRCYDKCAYAEEQNAAAEHENPNLRFKEYEEGAKHPAFLALEDEWKRCKHGQVYPCEDCVVEVSSSQPPSAAPAGREVVSVPRVLTDDMAVAFCEVWYSKRRAIDDSEMGDAYAAMLLAAPQAAPALELADELERNSYHQFEGPGTLTALEQDGAEMARVVPYPLFARVLAALRSKGGRRE